MVNCSLLSNIYGKDNVESRIVFASAAHFLGEGGEYPVENGEQLHHRTLRAYRLGQVELHQVAVLVEQRQALAEKLTRRQHCLSGSRAARVGQAHQLCLNRGERPEDLQTKTR